ncbi:hypothetical protein HDU98_010989 [Podochytrium sp. JEL0797]|nr:hypothetical protein HDU98_010989 [Podochytrium sp. JEL0797]
MRNTPSLGADKPFVTEYKLSFKDPSPFLKKSGSTKKQKKNQAPKPPAVVYVAPPLPVKVVDNGGGVFPSLGSGSIVNTRQGQQGGRKSKSTKNLWAPPPPRNGIEETSLNLPGMVNGKHQLAFDDNLPLVKTFRRRRVLNPVVKSTTEPPLHRYNILSGAEIFAEPYSGYREGKRAVIQTFAHLDMTTNARTPGYNIISNRDYLVDEMNALAV